MVRVELADPPDINVRLVGLREAVSPLGVARVSEIVPEKPPKLNAVIVADPREPVSTRRVDVLDVMPKSGAV